MDQINHVQTIVQEMEDVNQMEHVLVKMAFLEKIVAKTNAH